MRYNRSGGRPGHHEAPRGSSSPQWHTETDGRKDKSGLLTANIRVCSQRPLLCLCIIDPFILSNPPSNPSADCHQNEACNCKSKHITPMFKAHSCLHRDCPLLHSYVCSSYPAFPTLHPGDQGPCLGFCALDGPALVLLQCPPGAHFPHSRPHPGYQGPLNLYHTLYIQNPCISAQMALSLFSEPSQRSSLGPCGLGFHVIYTRPFTEKGVGKEWECGWVRSLHLYPCPEPHICQRQPCHEQLLILQLESLPP